MIYTYFDLFNNTQLIYYKSPKDKEGKMLCTCRLENLSETLARLAKQYNNNDIHIYGNQSYGEGLKQNIEYQLNTKFSENKINIYLN